MVTSFVGGKNLFKQKAGQKPVWKIVKSYDSPDVPSCLFVVPGAYFMFAKESSGQVFTDINTEGINTAPQPGWEVFQGTKQNGQKAGASINGKHP